MNDLAKCQKTPVRQAAVSKSLEEYKKNKQVSMKSQSQKKGDKKSNKKLSSQIVTSFS